MSRFANPQAKERVALGPCECPGKPHEEDWVELRSELGAEAFENLNSQSATEQIGGLIVGWNLLDFDGSEAPVDNEHVGRLFSDNLEPITKFIADKLRLVTGVPNSSAARSPRTTGASGSRQIPRVRKAA